MGGGITGNKICLPDAGGQGHSQTITDISTDSIQTLDHPARTDVAVSMG